LSVALEDWGTFGVPLQSEQSVLSSGYRWLLSDFDGATIPAGIGNAAGLQNLVEIMRTRGYDEPLIEKCFKNWLRVLGQTWGKV
jgi:hypothetical protein